MFSPFSYYKWQKQDLLVEIKLEWVSSTERINNLMAS